MKLSRQTRKQISEIKRAATMLLVIVLGLMIAAHGALALVLICTLAGGLVAGHIIGTQRAKSRKRSVRKRAAVKRPHANPSKASRSSP